MAIFRMTNIMQTADDFDSGSPVTPISDLPVTELNFFDTMQTAYTWFSSATATSLVVQTSYSPFRSGNAFNIDFYGRVFTTATFTGTALTYPSGSTALGSNNNIASGTINSFALYNGIHWNDPLTPQPFGQLIQQQTITVEGLNVDAAQLNVRDLDDILLRVNFGDDQIYGSNVKDIIEAGAGNDEVWGGDGNDSINGGDGNDRLRGEAGDDYIVGGGGLDYIYGGIGNDTLIGQGGFDVIFGDAGDDTLSGEADSDDLKGGDGNDILYGGDGSDRLFGDAGDDTLYGGNGNDDMILGGDGNDLIFGGDGNDRIGGGNGNDFLVGGAGEDILQGDAGDDGILFDREDRLSAYQGGTGFDTLFIDFAAGGNPFAINLAAQGFEQAIVTRSDTENLPWAQIITVYDSAWRVSKYDFVQDDGSKSVWYQDTDSSRPWRELRDYFTASGDLDFQQIFNDDGTTRFIDFDLANTERWSIRNLVTDASGKILSDTYVADVPEARYEHLKPPVKAYALPDGGIL